MRAEVVNSTKKQKIDCMTSEFHVQFHGKTNIVSSLLKSLPPPQASLLIVWWWCVCIVHPSHDAPRALFTSVIPAPGKEAFEVLHHLSVELSTHLNMCYMIYFHYYFGSPKKASYKYKTVQIRI